MKLRALELVAFGGMRDKVLRLAPDRPFHVAYAPNEAGKSTMRRGLLALLFGIGGQDPDAAVFQSDTKVAGQFETADGLTTLTRHKRIKPPLVTNEAGQDWGAQLAQLQLGRSREAYARAFALDHLGLAGFAHALAHEGPLAALAGAELGGLDVAAMQRTLEDAATKLATDVATRSKKKEIALAIEEMRRVETELHAVTVSPSRVASGIQACSDAETQLATLRGEERAQAQAVWHGEQRAQLSREAQELELQLVQLHAMAPPCPVTEEQLSEAQAHHARLTRAHDAQGRIDAERMQLHARIRTLPVHDANVASAARAMAQQHVELEALVQAAEALSELQNSLREARTSESLLRVEQQSLGLAPPLPLTEGWLLLIARWRGAALNLERHRQDPASRQEPARAYTDGDLEALEGALARAELAASPDVVDALAKRMARATKEHDELSRGAPTAAPAIDLSAMRRARDASLKAHHAEGRAATPELLGAWLDAAEEVDRATDSLLSQATSGAHHAEALRAASSALEHVRADVARARVQADAATKELRDALRGLAIAPPSNDAAVLQKGREAADRLRRALAKAHEDVRRFEIWRQQDAEFTHALKVLDDEAASVWGVVLGARLHAVADKVLVTCERSVHIASECARLEEAVRFASALLAERAERLPAPKPAPNQEGKTYLKQLAEARRTAAAQAAEAASYESALQTLAALELSHSRAAQDVSDAEAALARCLEQLGVVQLPALEEARAQTRAHERAQAQAQQRQAAIAAGAARIGLELSDALVPSRLADAHLHQTRAQRDQTLAALQAAELHLQSQLRELHQLQGHGTRALELSEERAATAAKLEEMLTRYVRLRSASTLLSGALREHRDAKLDPLLQCTSGYMKALTGGTYDTVCLDPQSDTPELQVRAGNGRPRAVYELSDGTRDQLGLATRLAYEELHASPDALPLLLDDVLVHFDDERAANALRALSVFCTKRPVLLLTHHAHVLELARAHVPDALLDVTGLVSR